MNNHTRELIEDTQDEYEPDTASWKALGRALEADTIYACASESLRRSIGFYQNENGTFEYDLFYDQISFDLECPEDSSSNLLALAGGAKTTSANSRIGGFGFFCIPLIIVLGMCYKFVKCRSQDRY